MQNNKKCEHAFKSIGTINGGVHGSVDISECKNCKEIQEIVVPFTGANGRYTKVAKGTGAHGTDWVITSSIKN